MLKRDSWLGVIRREFLGMGSFCSGVDLPVGNQFLFELLRHRRIGFCPDRQIFFVQIGLPGW